MTTHLPLRHNRCASLYDGVMASRSRAAPPIEFGQHVLGAVPGDSPIHRHPAGVHPLDADLARSVGRRRDPVEGNVHRAGVLACRATLCSSGDLPIGGLREVLVDRLQERTVVDLAGEDAVRLGVTDGVHTDPTGCAWMRGRIDRELACIDAFDTPELSGHACHHARDRPIVRLLEHDRALRIRDDHLRWIDICTCDATTESVID